MATAVAKRMTAVEKINTMQSLGIHYMPPDWASQGQGIGRNFSASFRQTTLKIYGSTEEMSMPVQTCTTVLDVKSSIASTLFIGLEQISFIVKQGCTWRVQLDSEQVASKVTVKGIKSFKPLPHEWLHPIAFIGAGYNGIKNGMKWLKDGSTNFVIFDRNDRVGGYCWLTAANKHSKLQTEFAAFHVWYGPEYAEDTRCGGYPKDWEVWPQRARVREHFQYAAEQYGVLPHCRLRSEVASMMLIGGKDELERAYDLNVKSLETEELSNFRCSAMLNFPGCMTMNRIVDYPGEDVFGGQIGYGMGDGIPYDHLQDSRTAILGNGAFAIENVRTCCEYGTEKVFVVTRRNSLPCPRLSCWLVHQAKVPIPGKMLLMTFEQMFELAGLPDPFSYYSVYGTRESKTVTISQSTRFGIGDIAFLACAYGKLEYVEDTVKRLSKHTLVLSTGRKLEKVTNIIKALGLEGDFAVDRLHKLREMVGVWCNGDFKRPLHMDSPGMHAANFDTMSTNMGSWYLSHQWKYLLDFPREYYRGAHMGIVDMLPRHKDGKTRPIYVYDVKHAMAAGTVGGGFFYKLNDTFMKLSQYKHDVYHRTTPLSDFLELCKQDWDSYQEKFRKQGSKQEYIPYPYSLEDVQGWISSHREATRHLSVDDSELAAKSDMAREPDGQYVQASFMWWVANDRDAQHRMTLQGEGKKKMTSTRGRSAPPIASG